MLLILIPIAWLAVATVFVAVCQASAWGEAAASPEEPGYRVREGLVVWDRDAAIALRYRRDSVPGPAPAAPAIVRPRRASRRGRFATTGVR